MTGSVEPESAMAGSLRTAKMDLAVTGGFEYNLTDRQNLKKTAAERLCSIRFALDGWLKNSVSL